MKGIALPGYGVQRLPTFSLLSLIPQERLNVLAFFTVTFSRCQCPSSFSAKNFLAKSEKIIAKTYIRACF